MKCAVYWPDASTEKLTIGNFTITLVEEQQFAEYVVRKLKYVFNNVSDFTWPKAVWPSTFSCIMGRGIVRTAYSSWINSTHSRRKQNCQKYWGHFDKIIPFISQLLIITKHWYLCRLWPRILGIFFKFLNPSICKLHCKNTKTLHTFLSIWNAQYGRKLLVVLNLHLLGKIINLQINLSLSRGKPNQKFLYNSMEIRNQDGLTSDFLDFELTFEEQV